MVRAVKILFGLILLIVALLATAIVVITRVIDPNDFKPQISTAAREHADIDLLIPGELSWTFWPYLGISVGRTEARLADETELFAALDEVRTSVAVWPLLFGEVQLSGIHLSGLELNLVETADGANWERIAAGDSEAADTETGTSADEGVPELPVSLPLVTISDSRIRYRNLMDGTDIQIDDLNFQARDVSLTEAFPMVLSLRYQDQDDIRIDLSLDTVLGMDLGNNVFNLTPLNLNSTIAGVTSLPVKVSLRQNLTAALDEDRISVRDLVLDAAGVRASGNMELTQLSGKPIFKGQLSVAPFNANNALKAIGELPIETSDPAALSSISMEMTFNGPENSLFLDPLVIQMDNSRISGQAGITDLDSGHIRFDLLLDKLLADGYLPPSEEPVENPNLTASTAILPPLSTEPLLPLEDLRALSVDGVFRIGALSLEGIETSNMHFTLNAKDGLLQLLEATGNALGGEFNASAALDARTDEPVITLKKSVKNVQIQPVVIMALDDDLFTGLLDMNMDFRATGNSEQALADSGVGALKMTLSKGTIRGMNLHNTLIGGVNEMLGSYQMLASYIPGQESGRLPRQLSEDTEVVQMHINARLEKLVAHVDELRAELPRGALNGKGFLNLRSEAFDFRIGMRSEDLSGNKYIGDRSWPLRCRGNLAGDAGDWCSADSSAFRDIGKDIAAKLAQDKVLDRLGLDADSARQELDAQKAAAREKARTEQERIKQQADKAKKEAEDDIRRKAEDGLRNLLNR